MKPKIFVETDHNADDVRAFYEIPESLSRVVQPKGDTRTFTQCLADLIMRCSRAEYIEDLKAAEYLEDQRDANDV